METSKALCPLRWKMEIHKLTLRNILSLFNNLFLLGKQVFMKIAEPRVVRIVHFGIYASILIVGCWVLHYQPDIFQPLLHLFGIFTVFGATLAMIAVLPGVWWLERVGISSLFTSALMSMYTMLVNKTAYILIVMTFALLLTLVLRFLEIKRYQLAPREE